MQKTNSGIYQFLTRQQVAEALQASLSTIARGIRSGREEPFCHFIKVGRRRLLPAAALEQLNVRAGVVFNFDERHMPTEKIGVENSVSLLSGDTAEHEI